MRGLKSTLALLVVLVGLGAYIYFVVWEMEDDTASDRERVFAELDADKIDEIRIRAESGEATTVKKEGDVWRVTSPLSVDADASELASITSNLSRLEITRIVDENPADLAEYGLEAPLVEVEFKASTDKNYAEPRRLLLGTKSPTGTDVFAKRDGENRVFLISGFLESIFNRPTFNLRDKTLVEFERDKLDRLSFASPDRTLELVKEGDNWRLTRPLAAMADSATVDGLITRVQTSPMKSVVVEQAAPTDLRMYGFDRPQGTLVLRAGETAASLIVGGRANDNDVYARDASKSLVATIDDGLLDDLNKAPDEFRRRQILSLNRFSTSRLEFTRDGQTTTFEKTMPEGQPEKWSRVGPAAGEPDAMNMERLLTALESLRATSFASATDKTGLANPSLTVYARFESTKEERVTFARPAASGADVYAAIPGEPGAAVVSATSFDELLKALDAVSK